MYYYEVAPTQIIRPGSESFTYASEEALSSGTLVEIELGKKSAVGLILNTVVKPSYATKSVGRIIEDTPLPPDLLKIAKWMSDYYHTPLATVLQTVLPKGVTKSRRSKEQKSSSRSRARTNFVLNKEQRSVLSQLATRKGTVLLHGVTGSGKTAVYIEQAKKTLAKGASVIILVPEIALTSQLLDEFSQHFSDILLTHSRQTEAERHLLWKEVLDSDAPRIVIGPRSALFMPLKKLGLIVVDECHEPSFMQEQSPRYSALRVASQYATFADGLSIFGSATPLVTDYYLATQAKAVLTLTKPAQTDTTPPDISVVDMTKRSYFKRHRFLSEPLLKGLEETFSKGKQALIFHNRRGSASTTLCENCGWQAGCPRCFIPLTLHADAHELRCHICAMTSKVPTSCPVCHHANIIHKGIGTKMIEAELTKLFPKQTIRRFDGDSGPGESLDAQYDQLYRGEIDLIIGTQIVAKGLDLPNLRTVGVIQADSGLSLPDYSSGERTFQLLAQVIGRVGRSHHPSDVIIQSYQPTHPVVTDGIAQNYADFYRRMLALRKATHFPPYRFLLKLTCVYKTEAAAVRNARQLANQLTAHAKPNVEVLGPTPAFYERTRDTYRWQLVVRSARRQDLVALLEHLPPTHWQYELDPLSLL